MARGGGQVSHVQTPRPTAPNPLAVFAEKISQLPQQMMQARFMQNMLDQQAAKEAEAAQQQAGYAQGAQQIGQELGRTVQMPFMQGAVSPADQERITRLQQDLAQASDAAIPGLGNANTRIPDIGDRLAQQEARRAGLFPTANSLREQVSAAEQRAFSAKGITDTIAELNSLGLEPEEINAQAAILRAAANMVRTGSNLQAVQGLIPSTHPNVQARIQMRARAVEASNMQDQNAADAATTRDYLTELARGNPEMAEQLGRLAQVEGLVIWGAAKGLTDLLSNRENSRAFRANADRDHAQTMTEIGARNARARANAAALTARDILETARNKTSFGVLDTTGAVDARTGQPQRRAIPFAEAFEQTIQEIRIAAPALMTPELEAEIRGMDPQVLEDYSFYGTPEQLEKVTPETWPFLARQLASEGERSPQQIRDLHNMLQPLWGRRNLEGRNRPLSIGSR
jgi:hypothetical protein